MGTALDFDEIWFDGAGTRLYAVARGSGRPLILIHGGLANHRACWVFGAPLAERFRVITPDLRGAGRSILPPHSPSGMLRASAEPRLSIDHRPLRWEQFADDIAALVRHLGVPRAAIGGVSFGAGVAVATALRHPDVVDALIVLAPAYGGAELGLAPAQVAAMRAMDACGSRAVAEGVQVMLPLFDALPPAIRERAREIVATYDAGSVAATTAFMASGAQPFARGAELAAIAAPVLLVPGTDPQHPREVADVYRAHLPRCVVREVDATGYAAAIGDFLDATIASS